MDEHPSRDRAGAAVRSSGRRLPNVKVPQGKGERGTRVRERGTPNGELRTPSVEMVKVYRRARSGVKFTGGRGAVGSLPAGEERAAGLLAGEIMIFVGRRT